MYCEHEYDYKIDMTVFTIGTFIAITLSIIVSIILVLPAIHGKYGFFLFFGGNFPFVPTSQKK